MIMPAEALDLPLCVVVTGAGGGIGSALVARLLAAGVSVLASDLGCPPAALKHPLLAWVTADLSTPAGRQALVEAAAQRFGSHGHKAPLGGFVHIAGIIDPVDWDAIDEAQIERIFSINLQAPFFLVRALLPVFSPDASVVLLGSISALRASPKTPFYAASKAALRNLGASMAMAWQSRGIRVNVVAPGLIDTPLTDALNVRLAAERGVLVEQVAAERAQAIPAGRPGTVDEVVSACVYFLSRQSSYCTGATLHPTGGVMAGAI